jgi:hypothetical protein
MATDMLVDLRTFMRAQPARYAKPVRDLDVRRATDSDYERLSTFVVSAFSDENWGGATAVAYARDPASAFIALRAGEIVGFAFYDLAFRGYFGTHGCQRRRSWQWYRRAAPRRRAERYGDHMGMHTP